MTSRLSPTHAAIAVAIAAFLLAFLIVPVLTVIYVAFTNSDGSLTLSHFYSFFQLTLMRESFYNSLYVGGMISGSTPSVWISTAPRNWKRMVK